jgi:hypothetical protein
VQRGRTEEDRERHGVNRSQSEEEEGETDRVIEESDRQMDRWTDGQMETKTATASGNVRGRETIG